MKQEIRTGWAWLVILCLAQAFADFDLYGINFLMPSIKPALQLTNTQVGALVSGFAATMSLSSFGVSALADRLGRPKTFLVITLALFGCLSVLSGMATSFEQLMGARLVMGLLNGPVAPLVQTLVAVRSPEAHRGRNAGIVATVGSSIVASFAGPLILVFLSQRFGWQAGFFVVALPGLVCAVLVALLIPEASTPVASHANSNAPPEKDGGWKEVLRYRNVWLGMVTCTLVIGYISIGLAFWPLFLEQVKHYSSSQMGGLMSVLGFSSLVFGLGLPMISDRIGRKPPVILSGFLSFVCPLIVMYYSGPLYALIPIVFLGWTTFGAGTLCMATIPSETVPPHHIATAIGLILAVSTLVGGVASTSIAGWSADRWGLTAPMYIHAGCGAALMLASLYFRETAPAKVNKQPTPAEAHS